ncbi:hypothetical protein Q1695_003009 [Nippostrongylus brasiliensis]|nr:hypothetical protein Q1695_003009 [Nippostrongylus brasiliensis]
MVFSAGAIQLCIISALSKQLHSFEKCDLEREELPEFIGTHVKDAIPSFFFVLQHKCRLFISTEVIPTETFANEEAFHCTFQDSQAILFRWDDDSLAIMMMDAETNAARLGVIPVMNMIENGVNAIFLEEDDNLSSFLYVDGIILSSPRTCHHPPNSEYFVCYAITDDKRIVEITLSYFPNTKAEVIGERELLVPKNFTDDLDQDTSIASFVDRHGMTSISKICNGNELYSLSIESEGAAEKISTISLLHEAHHLKGTAYIVCEDSYGAIVKNCDIETGKCFFRFHTITDKQLSHMDSKCLYDDVSDILPGLIMKPVDGRLSSHGTRVKRNAPQTNETTPKTSSVGSPKGITIKPKNGSSTTSSRKSTTSTRDPSKTETTTPKEETNMTVDSNDSGEQNVTKMLERTTIGGLASTNSSNGTTPTPKLTTTSHKGTTIGGLASTNSSNGTTPTPKLTTTSHKGTTIGGLASTNSSNGTTPTPKLTTTSHKGTTIGGLASTNSSNGTTPTPNLATTSHNGTTIGGLASTNSSNGTTPTPKLTTTSHSTASKSTVDPNIYSRQCEDEEKKSHSGIISDNNVEYYFVVKDNCGIYYSRSPISKGTFQGSDTHCPTRWWRTVVFQSDDDLLCMLRMYHEHEWILCLDINEFIKQANTYVKLHQSQFKAIRNTIGVSRSHPYETCLKKQTEIRCFAMSRNSATVAVSTHIFYDGKTARKLLEKEIQLPKNGVYGAEMAVYKALDGELHLWVQHRGDMFYNFKLSQLNGRTAISTFGDDRIPGGTVDIVFANTYVVVTKVCTPRSCFHRMHSASDTTEVKCMFEFKETQVVAGVVASSVPHTTEAPQAKRTGGYSSDDELPLQFRTDSEAAFFPIIILGLITFVYLCVFFFFAFKPHPHSNLAELSSLVEDDIAQLSILTKRAVESLKKKPKTQGLPPLMLKKLPDQTTQSSLEDVLCPGNTCRTWNEDQQLQRPTTTFHQGPEMFKYQMPSDWPQNFEANSIRNRYYSQTGTKLQKRSALGKSTTRTGGEMNQLGIRQLRHSTLSGPQNSKNPNQQNAIADGPVRSI